MQRVARGARHDVAGQPDGLVVDQVEQRHPAAAAEVARVGAGVDAADRHDELDAVNRAEQPDAWAGGMSAWAVMSGAFAAA